MLFGSGAAVVFMWVVVHHPIHELTAGMRRVASGDLEYRLPVGRDDELGDLAASFNKMTAEVGGVHATIEAEVRRKTAELERVHKTLLHSEKMASVGKLAATVAHEINNPLFGILTYARLVMRELLKHEIPGRDDLCEQLQTIERESKRCGELVKSLLTFSRQAPSIREPTDLNTVVHRAVVLVQHIPLTTRRITGIVSRGGSILAEWMVKNHKQNMLYECFEDICKIFQKHDVTFSPVSYTHLPIPSPPSGSRPPTPCRGS